MLAGPQFLVTWMQGAKQIGQLVVSLLVTVALGPPTMSVPLAVAVFVAVPAQTSASVEV